MQSAECKMNFRKSLYSAAAFAYAAPLAAAPSGFFLGGLLGATALKGEHTYTVSGDPSVGKISKMSPHAGIDAGYLISMSDGKACIGAEVYATVGGPVVKKTLMLKTGVVQGQYSIASKNVMGAAIITGMMLNPRLMGYARVGYEMQSYEFKYTELTFESPNSKTYKKRATGLAPGGGLLFRVNQQLSVMVDATVPVMPKITIRAKDSNDRSMEYSPAMQRITCRVIYTF